MFLSVLKDTLCMLRPIPFEQAVKVVREWLENGKAVHE